jgi:hypothetical protein
MKSGYLYIELVDVHLVLGECNGNSTDAIRRYRKNNVIGDAKSSCIPFS